MDTELTTLDEAGLRQFHLLRADAVGAVTDRLYAMHGAVDAQSGARGRDACREDLAFHLEFLRPVLAFGLLQPMVEYLCWLGSVLEARSIPAKHVALSLALLGEFFAERMAGADGAVVAAALRAARVAFLSAEAMPPAPAVQNEPWPEVAAFETALLAGQQHAAFAVMHRCMDSGRGLVDVELHVVQPALYHIGEGWQANWVSVASEHLATAIAQSAMTVGLLRSPPPTPNSKRALLACVEGNSHTVGLRMVADALELAGWDVQYLGANVPTAALTQQAAEWPADLVGLSVSFAQQLPAVKDVIARLTDKLGAARPALIIGGLAINRFNRLAAMVGADAYGADAPTAVVCANRLLGC